MLTIEQCAEHSEYRYISPNTIDTINSYVTKGLPAGGFVTAVLENNLLQAFARADDMNTAHMREIVTYCYNEIPSGCWGSPDKVLKHYQTFKMVKRVCP